MKWLALDSHGRRVAHLLAENYIDAVLFIHRGGVPGAHDVIGDNAYSDGDIKATEARLIAAFQENGLTEKQAKIAARGRDRDRPIRDFLPTIRVPHERATAGSSWTTAHISERSSQQRERESLDLREPTATDRESDGLAELVERGARDSVAEALADLYVGFRRSGMSKAEALAAARGRDYPRYGTSSTISEGTQEMGAEIPIAYAMLMSYPQPDGTTTAQWRIRCPLCGQIHFSPGDPATLDDPTNLLGEQAMLCRQGVADVVDAATNPPPEPGTGNTVVPSGEAARGDRGLAKIEADLVTSFCGLGLSEAEARVAARGRDRR